MSDDVALRVEREIGRLDRREWMAATGGAGFYLDYDWLASGVGAPGDDRRFLLTGPGSSPAGAAVCYLLGRDAFPFYDPVQLLFGEAEVTRLAGALPAGEAKELRALAALLRSEVGDRSLACVAPGFLCGLACTAAGEAAGAPARLVSAILDLARTAGAGAAGALYLGPSDEACFGPALQAAGLAPALMGADCVLTVRWHGLEEYLAAQDGRRRWLMRYEMRRFREAGLVVEVRGAEAIVPALAELQANVQRKYGHRPDVASFRRQHEVIRRDLADRVRLFLARGGSRIVGFVLCYESDGVLYARSIGFDYEALGADFCYFNVYFYSPIAYAAEHGLREIQYSMESYEAKVRRGCRVRPLVGYVRLETPRQDALVRCLALGSKARAAHLARYDPEAFTAWSHPSPAGEIRAAGVR